MTKKLPMPLLKLTNSPHLRCLKLTNRPCELAHGIERALVLCEGNVEVRGDVVCAPAYLTLAVGGPAGS